MKSINYEERAIAKPSGLLSRGKGEKEGEPVLDLRISSIYLFLLAKAPSLLENHNFVNGVWNTCQISEKHIYNIRQTQFGI